MVKDTGATAVDSDQEPKAPSAEARPEFARTGDFAARKSKQAVLLPTGEGRQSPPDLRVNGPDNPGSETDAKIPALPRPLRGN